MKNLLKIRTPLDIKMEKYEHKYRLDLKVISNKSNLEFLLKYLEIEEYKNVFDTCQKKIKSNTHFLVFLKNRNIDTINRKDIEKYMFLLKEEFTIKEFNKKIKFLRIFLNYMLMHSNIKPNLILSSDIIKTSVDKEYFAIEEEVLAKLLEHIEEIPNKDYILFFKIGIETGLRADDIKKIKNDCLKEEVGIHYLLYDISKMKIKNHEVVIHKKLYDLIENKIKDNKLSNASNDKNLLLPPYSKKGQYFNTTGVKENINNILIKYNIKGNNGKIWHYTNHQVRHLKIKNLYDSKKMDILHIKEYIGHRQESMTERYLQTTDKEVKDCLVNKESKIFDISIISNLKKGYEATRVFEGYCIKPKIFPCDKEACFNCEYYNKDNIGVEIEKTESLMEMLKNKKIDNKKNEEYLNQLKGLNL